MDTNKQLDCQDIASLKKYFRGHTEIAFSFLFGSQAKGIATRLSDVDIAVYFRPEIRHPIQYEEEVYYKGEDEIWSDLEKLLKREVDMLVLNRVSPVVAASAIRGVPLAINDWGLYLDFMEVITHEAEDFVEMALTDFMERRKLEKRAQKTSAEAH